MKKLLSLGLLAVATGCAADPIIQHSRSSFPMAGVDILQIEILDNSDEQKVYESSVSCAGQDQSQFTKNKSIVFVVPNGSICRISVSEFKLTGTSSTMVGPSLPIRR